MNPHQDGGESKFRIDFYSRDSALRIFENKTIRAKANQLGRLPVFLWTNSNLAADAEQLNF